MVFYGKQTFILKDVGKATLGSQLFHARRTFPEHSNTTERYLWGESVLSLQDVNLGRKVILKESYLF